MLFNSIDFAIFLPISFALYWLIGSSKPKAQNWFLVFASYLFYGWWDWRFLTLISFSTIIDYSLGQLMASKPNKKRLWLGLSIAMNIGLLGYFKYFNFFLDSLSTAFQLFGQPVAWRGMDIILPIGISFYTFQTLSYTIDVYRDRIRPSNSLIEFAAYVSFFPQLVAGPIERAKQLLPQFRQTRRFNYSQAAAGMRQILWGLFKKMVIADNCAMLVDEVFQQPESHSPITLLLALVLFGFQIYGDFSGYSDIAIGVAKLFGIQLMQNFRFPFFSRDIAEFWRRWHISLSTWFRDYLYQPLGGSKCSTLHTLRNVSIVFLVSGLWHGAQSTYIVWGALHNLLYLPLLHKNLRFRHRDSEPSLKLQSLAFMSVNFLLISYTWLYFRAPSLSFIKEYHQLVLFGHWEASLSFSKGGRIPLLMALLLIFNLVEWVNRKEAFGLARLPSSAFWRWLVYILLIFSIGAFYGQAQNFIYFQF
jgi:D-alanyl-lipoteichoic acid acyltransferase DltB (MBOAT superfamily)